MRIENIDYKLPDPLDSFPSPGLNGLMNTLQLRQWLSSEDLLKQLVELKKSIILKRYEKQKGENCVDTSMSAVSNKLLDFKQEVDSTVEI